MIVVKKLLEILHDHIPRLKYLFIACHADLSYLTPGTCLFSLTFIRSEVFTSCYCKVHESDEYRLKDTSYQMFLMSIAGQRIWVIGTLYLFLICPLTLRTITINACLMLNASNYINIHTRRIQIDCQCSYRSSDENNSKQHSKSDSNDILLCCYCGRYCL